MWLVLALCSAVFAALTSILAKLGIDGVNSHLSTAIRTAVVLAMAWAMVLLTGAQGGLAAISKRSWLFLILSGLATGVSRGWPPGPAGSATTGPCSWERYPRWFPSTSSVWLSQCS